MDEQECLVAYLELVEMLNEVGLNWLVERVADTIKRGKPVVVRDNGQQYSRLDTEPYTRCLLLVVLVSGFN